MKNIILTSIIAFVFSSIVISVQGKPIVLTVKHQNQQNTQKNSPTPAPQPAPGKITLPRKTSTPPPANRIAVSDSGNPADKKNSTKKKATVQPAGKKVSGNTPN